MSFLLTQLNYRAWEFKLGIYHILAEGREFADERVEWSASKTLCGREVDWQESNGIVGGLLWTNPLCVPRPVYAVCKQCAIHLRDET